MALDISTFVDISTTISTGGGARLPFGRGLLVTIDSAIAAGGSGKAQLFNNINEVNAVLSAGDALDAATVWFSADPRPQGLYIGRWATTDVSTTLSGTATVAAGTAPLNSSAGTFTLNGNTVTANLSAAGTYLAIATAVQTAIVALGGIFAGATFTVTSSTFTLTLAGSDLIGPPYFGGATTGTNIADALGMGQADSPTYRQGHGTESVADALGELVAISSPLAIMLAGDAPLTHNSIDTRIAVAAYASAGDYIFALLDTSAQALVTGDTTSPSALAFSSSQGQVAATFDNAGAQPDVGLLALMSSQNLNNRASIITAHAKVVPGVLASDITPTQYEELKRKRVNVVAPVGGVSRLVGGTTSRAGYWLDAQWWLLWIKNEMQLAVWDAMGASRRLTSGQLTDAVTEVLEKGVRNGGIMPGGVVNATTKADIISSTGNQEFNGTIAAGYVLWVERQSVRTASDRANRLGRFKAWLAPSEAIHEVMGDIILSG